MYYTYMIRCLDNSIYTGITTDLQRRMKELASKLEYHMKHLPKSDKEKIIKDNGNIEILNKKLDCAEYTRIEIKERI